MKLINQPFGRSRHQSKHRQKSPFFGIKPIHQSVWQKSPSIKPLTEVAINQSIGKSNHLIKPLAEVAINQTTG